MKKKIIKKIAKDSFTKDGLDPKRIDKYAKLLKKSDLKVYIKELKNIKSEKIVTVTVPNENGIKDLSTYFKRIYPGKKIVVKFDESLINGVRVVEQNNEYEFSLRSFMEEAYRVKND